jgi:hypothetical protein
MLFRNGGATARTFNACTISAIIDVVSDVHGVVSLFRVLPHLARSCRLRHCSKVGRYLGYTDRDRGLISAAAFDPMYGPAVRRKRFSSICRIPGSCINVSGL